MTVYDYNNITESSITAGVYTIPAKGELRSSTSIADLEALLGLGIEKYVDGVYVQTQLVMNPSTNQVYANNSTTQISRIGFWDYNDTATAATPISVTGGGGYVILTNNGLGSFTNFNYILKNHTHVWNTSTNRFDWSQLKLGDTVDIRLDIEVVTTAPNQTVDVSLTMAYGSANQYELSVISDLQFKNAGTKALVRPQGIYMGDTPTLNNPSVFRIKSDANCTVKVNGWYVRVLRV